MKQQTACRNDLPTAFITKGKQRRKQFNGNVYLENNDTFEIELFNPETFSILAKININDKSIGNGIVIRPGERVFLERYLTDNKKFLFSTYTVNGSNKSVREAIKLNGIVGIQFFKEQIHTPPIAYYNSISAGGYAHPTTTTFGDPFTTLNSNMLYDSNVSFCSAGLGNVTHCSGNVDIGSSSPTSTLSVTGNNKLETGQITKGDVSKQQLTTVDMDFEYNSYHSIEWHILPTSTQHIHTSDIKQYCVSCGTRIKKSSYKYCPTCGTEID